MANDPSRSVMVFAAKRPDSIRLHQMMDVKKACEMAGVSLPEEVVDFFKEFPSSSDEYCSIGLHTHIFQEVRVEYWNDGVAILIPRHEIEAQSHRSYNNLLVMVPFELKKP